MDTKPVRNGAHRNRRHNQKKTPTKDRRKEIMQTEYVKGKRRSECANIRPGRAAK